MYGLINWALEQVNRRSPVLVQTPNHRSFGNAAEEIFYGLLRARRENKKVWLLYPRLALFGKRFFVANEEEFQLESDSTVSNDTVVASFVGCALSGLVAFLRILHLLRGSATLRRVARVFRPRLPERAALDYGYIVPQIGKSRLWMPDGIKSFSWSVVRAQKWKEQYERYVPPRLRRDKFQRAERTRIEMGIPLSEWFVCLHLSESRPSTARNASILNCIEAIESITGAGGWVVRLGDPRMTPLPAMHRVIDYAHSEHQSALMDLYLISQCRFFTGLNSGPCAVATLFQKPMALVDLSEWMIAYPLKKGDLAILKHVYSRSRGRFLSVSEMLEESFAVQPVKGTGSDEYVVVENTPAEIRALVEEFITALDDRSPYEYSATQQTFNQKRRVQIRRWLREGEPLGWLGVPDEDVFIHQYRMAAVLDAAGTLGRRYLEQNWTTDALAHAGAQEVSVPAAP